ncbi:MAG: 2-amino-4-hydroxy-6-hydroxymethyldihydropteridine diphosphokinase [Planctomycetes bacterium]|nr:2-amino-4-hydroxy-6-hydroxymethyldihydropteridine diphosphokinase [Planctomycetota bacterium]
MERNSVIVSEGPSNRAFLSLGSNIDPETNLSTAVRELQRFGRIVAVSQVWETEPVGFADQPNFLNAALILETPLSASELLLEVIVEVETVLGRIRDPHNKNAPRTIDIDLALFNRDVLVLEQRQIPDPDILNRAFVAIPLVELAPEYIHPLENRTLAEIAAKFENERPSMQLRTDVILLLR